MASGNRPLNSEHIKIRIPPELRTLLEGMSVGQCTTLSHTIRRLLETHPEVVDMAQRLYDGLNMSEHGEVIPE